MRDRKHTAEILLLVKLNCAHNGVSDMGPFGNGARGYSTSKGGPRVSSV